MELLASLYQILLLVIASILQESFARISSSTDKINLVTYVAEEYCQEACLQKLNLKTHISNCFHVDDCVKCWDTCTSISRQASSEHSWPVRIASMVEQEFLVSTYLAWEPQSLHSNCIVTWEVSGGGLMGHLLTDSSNVELSLWPETVYRVQVTCSNEKTGKSVESYPLVVDTSQAIKMKPESMNDDETDGTKLISTPIIDISTVDPTIEWQAKMHVPYKYDSNLFVMKLRRQKEIVLGVCAAIIVFLFILTIFCALRRDDLHDKLYTINDNQTNNENEVILNEVAIVQTHIDNITIPSSSLSSSSSSSLHHVAVMKH